MRSLEETPVVTVDGYYDEQQQVRVSKIANSAGTTTNVSTYTGGHNDMDQDTDLD